MIFVLSHAILPKTALAKEIDFACAMATVALAASRQVCILIATSLSFQLILPVNFVVSYRRD